MKSDLIKAELNRQKLRGVEKQVASLQKQLSDTVAALVRARNVHRVKIPPPARPRAKLKGDHVIACCPDTHGAKVHKPALAAFLRDVKQVQPRTIVLLGDHVDCGGFLAQHHVMGYVAETKYSYEEDIAHANAFLDAVQAAAPNATIIYLEGNHERRVETWCVTQTLRHQKDSEMLRRAFAPEFLLRLKERGIRYCRVSEFHDGLPVPGVIRIGKCYYLHGFSTARHSVAVTQGAIAGNVVSAHTHRAQSDIIRKVSTGVVGSWNPGCITDPQPLWQHGKPTDWTLGHALQFVSHTDAFLHVNLPFVEGLALPANFAR